VLADVYALTQHEVVWASEAELTWTVADRAMSAAQEADTPVALAGAAWTLGMVQRSAGDTDGALSLARRFTGPQREGQRLAEQPPCGIEGVLVIGASARRLGRRAVMPPGRRSGIQP
jgi:hypothetical protein